MSEIKLLPCPFCGGEDIRYSLKTMGRREGTYHVAMYCNKCNCYGARTIINPTEHARWGVEKNPKYKEIAIIAWNTRKPLERILERIKEKAGSIFQDKNKGNQFVFLDDINEIFKEEGGIE